MLWDELDWGSSGQDHPRIRSLALGALNRSRRAMWTNMSSCNCLTQHRAHPPTVKMGDAPQATARAYQNWSVPSRGAVQLQSESTLTITFVFYVLEGEYQGMTSRRALVQGSCHARITPSEWNLVSVRKSGLQSLQVQSCDHDVLFLGRLACHRVSDTNGKTCPS